MVYEYEERNRGVILAGTLFDDGDIEKQPAFEELEEVYAKVKAFDELKDVIKYEHYTYNQRKEEEERYKKEQEYKRYLELKEKYEEDTQ